MASSSFPNRVDRNVYPPPEYRFPNAKIGLTYESSVADFPPPQRAPEDAPNILLVLLDDVGYGWTETFGGLIESPAAERLAQRGLRYCQFHTTALCSPTRAALLTGRNHHTVSTGTIQETATGFPGYTGIIPKSCATFAEVLSQNGYATGWWGKNHNVPDNQTSPAGPFDRWPTRMGFDYFYGFIGGEADQFYPALYRGTTPVDPPSTPEDGYHLTTDIADDCIGWMREQKAIAPDRPFFAYFAPGAAHAPHHPPLDRRGRHAGKFDMGWDEYRRIVHQRQIDAGVVPAGTALTPRPEEIPAWDDHTDEEKRLFARFAENFADFLEHADHEVGRLVDAIEELGELDNTIVLYIVGDNGSSGEGTLIGTHNEVAALGGVRPSIDMVMAQIDNIGLPETSPHYPVGWAWAGDAPFQWTKQIASHFGGTRNGMVVSWPDRITDHGGTRYQFHHVIDIAPTLLEIVGITEPSVVNGVPQRPIEGVSLAYSFDAAAADLDAVPSTRFTQYFEMFGHRALYNEGWIASCRHKGSLPWITAGSSADFTGDDWELYDIRNDFSQADDLAAKNPDKLRDLQDLFMAEAAKFNVLPLDPRLAERLDVTLRPSFFYGRKRVVFHEGMVRLPEGSGPTTSNVSHSITAKVTVPDGGVEGVIVCVGGNPGGWSLYVLDGKPVYHYNWSNFAHYQAVGDRVLAPGDHDVVVEFAHGGQRAGPAHVRLLVDGDLVGEVDVEHQTPSRFGIESFDVGVDKMSPVSPDYADRNGFPFTGRVRSVQFDFSDDGHVPTPAERLAQMLAMD